MPASGQDGTKPSPVTWFPRRRMPLSDNDGPFFPELTTCLDALGRSTPIGLMVPERKRKGRVLDPRPFLMNEARKRVSKAAECRGKRLVIH